MAVITTIIAVLVVAIVLEQFYYRFIAHPKAFRPHSHVIITGGSAGLGLATAIRYAAENENVGHLTLVGRSKAKLEAAKKAVLDAALTNARRRNPLIVFIYPADVTDAKAMVKMVEKALTYHNTESTHAKEDGLEISVEMLICCAGQATPGYFLEQSTDIFHAQMDVNYFGSLHAIKAVVPHMIRSDINGRIVLVSSACAYIGFIGYTQYSPTKYALRGLADALRNEMLLYGISISIFYPGNMDTPGYETEELTKPIETKSIEGTSDLVSASAASESMIQGIHRGTYAITNDVGVWILRVIGNGMAPRSSAVMELLLLPLAAVIQTVYVVFMDRVVTTARHKIRKAKAE